MLLMIELETSTSPELPRETPVVLARFGEFLFQFFIVGIKLLCSPISSSRAGLLISLQITIPYALETVSASQLFPVAR